MAEIIFFNLIISFLTLILVCYMVFWDKEHSKTVVPPVLSAKIRDIVRPAGKRKPVVVSDKEAYEMELKEQGG